MANKTASSVHDTKGGVMAVILAAGESSRMGSTKPLLAWDGKTLLRHCAERALASICDEVHVIVGPDATALERELEGLSLTTTRVEYAKDGMGATLAGTIQTLPDRTRGVVVLLCDQPFVTTDLIDDLVQRGKESEMVACTYDDTLGPPAYFSQNRFAELCGLTGDRGAKSILLQNAEAVVTVAFPLGTFDIDTPEDYDRALAELERRG